jgi:glycosyltransferase involved in cell wall biosynthesis
VSVSDNLWPVKSRIITAVPVRNGEEFIQQTLEALARQTVRPDRVVIFDNRSTDRTLDIARAFAGFHCEISVAESEGQSMFANFNRALELADQTEFLHILHADDTISPNFYETMTGVLAEGDGRGLAWCMDERIDEKNVHLSYSGKPDGRVTVLDRDTFLQRKAEIGNQAFCATLIKTAGQPVPVRFPLDYPVLGDQIFWAAYGAQCRKLVYVNQPLAQYRWHGSNNTTFLGPSLQSLVLDEWRTMETNEALRGRGMSGFRALKLKGLFAVRSGIKAKRIRQQGNVDYARQIVRVTKNITGPWHWLAGQALIELRDVYIYGILRHQRHPKNIYH